MLQLSIPVAEQRGQILLGPIVNSARGGNTDELDPRESGRQARNDGVFHEVANVEMEGMLGGTRVVRGEVYDDPRSVLAAFVHFALPVGAIAIV